MMGRGCLAALLGGAVAVAVLVAVVHCAVTYDKKAVLVDGQRRILFSGSIHYPRSTPEVCSSSNSILQECVVFFGTFRGGEFLFGGCSWRGLAVSWWKCHGKRGALF